MKLSATTRYAVRVLFELAAARGPLPLADISERTGIRLRTVENICAVLRRHGISSGIMGPGGGTRLEIPLKDISLGRLVELFEDGVELAVCCGDKANDCPNQHTCATRTVWRTISTKIQDELNAVSLATLLFHHQGGAGAADLFS